MGRPGTGGGGGGSSGGGNSFGRSSGGFQLGGGRPGTSGSGSSFSSGGGYYRGPTYMRFGGHHYYGGGPNIIVTIIILFFVFVVPFIVSSYKNASSVQSTRDREKIESPLSYKSDCIEDELGYIEQPQKLSKDLKYFHEKTGIQPYILMKKYDSSLSTNEEKEAFSREYYDKNIKNEKSFLYTYFEDADPNAVGYMTYVNGAEVSSIMDEEAINIFWNYIERYWTDGNLTMNDVFNKAFSKTADTIMTKSTTLKDIVKYVIIGIIILGSGIIIVILVKQKHKRDKEKGEETEKIVNTSLDEDDVTDELKNKYLKK